MSTTDCPNGSENCNFRCPSGGTWYACPDEPYFVGCCSSDPCTATAQNVSQVCPDVYAATFNPSIFDEISPNTCLGRPNNQDWYTCNFTDPPFLGCCGVNPCVEGSCPRGEVLPAAWSPSTGDQFELFDDRGGGDDGDDGGNGDGGLSGGAIAGIAIGAVAGVLLLLGLGWWFIWGKKRRDGKGTYAAAGHARGPSNGAMSEGGEYGYMHPQSPYQDSNFPSPNPTAPSTVKYPSGSSGFSPSLSPPQPSDGRPVSEMSGSDEHYRSGHNHGLGVFKPEPIQELDSTSKPPEVHELDGGNRS